MVLSQEAAVYWHLVTGSKYREQHPAEMRWKIKAPTETLPILSIDASLTEDSQHPLHQHQSVPEFYMSWSEKLK